MQPILGILGGMGPYATLDFIRNIYKVTPNINVDSDHIRIVSDINVKIPSRTRAVLFGEESPVQPMIESVEGLALLGAAYVAVPCNSAHYFYDLVNQYTTIEWINMLDIVADKIGTDDRANVLILGGYVTVTMRIYDQYIPQCCYLDTAGNELVFELIEDLKLAKGQYQNTVDKIIELCRGKKAETIVLACTELTEVAELFSGKGIKIIDSNRVYAEALVERVTTKYV
jgi:aspartate racemase